MSARAVAVAWLVVLAGAVALSLAVRGEGPLVGDEAVTDAIQAWPRPAESLSRAVRAITSTEPVLVMGAVAAVLLWAMRRRREALLLAAVLLVLPLVQSGVKEAVDRPRPSPALVEVRDDFSSESFPSGHVMSGVVLYGMGAYLALTRAGRERRLARTTAVAFGAVLAANTLANVVMGVHWPSDVLGGWLWGLAVLLPAVALDATQRNRAG